MTKIPRPMLACNQTVEDFDSITYPLVASAKLDGWRSYNVGGVPRTRSGKTIPNNHTRNALALPELEGLDGELICGSPTDRNAMQRAQSAFSTIAGEPEFTWYIFDDWKRARSGYWEWWSDKLRTAASHLPEFCTILPQQYITSAAELDQFVSEVLALGYEGVITRTPNSPYKHNRSTRKQEWMLKVKPWTYEEALIIGLNEKEANTNVATINSLGLTERSTHQLGKVGVDTLGSFTVRTPAYPSDFRVGCGHLDDNQKKYVWQHRKEFLNTLITFRHFKQTGVVNLPRQGQFVAFRAPEDFS